MSGYTAGKSNFPAPIAGPSHTLPRSAIHPETATAVVLDCGSTRMWSIRRQATRALTLFLRPLTQGEAAGQPKSCTRIRRPVRPRLAPLQGHMSGNEVFDSRKWRTPGPSTRCSRETRASEGSSWPHTPSGQTPQYLSQAPEDPLRPQARLDPVRHHLPIVHTQKLLPAIFCTGLAKRAGKR